MPPECWPAYRVNYSVSVVDGGGFKNPTRTKYVDFEGRLGFQPVDWLTVGIGGYTGHLGQVTTSTGRISHQLGDPP